MESLTEWYDYVYVYDTVLFKERCIRYCKPELHRDMVDWFDQYGLNYPDTPWKYRLTYDTMSGWWEEWGRFCFQPILNRKKRII